ncbi:hypothetical protein BH18ACT4_BH18ACT4_04980 [soil metagenome]
MDIRIGVTHASRDIELELPDDTDAAALESSVEEAVGRGAGMLWVADRRGRRVGVAVEKLSWIEIGSADDKGRIGFGS